MYRIRTDAEIEQMKVDMQRNDVVVPCQYDADTCYSTCGQFKKCWQTDYSKLEQQADEV